MATRVIPPRILRKLRYNTATKPFQPSLTSPTLSPPCNILDQKPPSTTTLLPPAVADLNFHDVEKLFTYVPTANLLRSTAVLHATAIEPMVDLGTWLMRSELMQTDNPLRNLALAATRSTFFDHFCAGEDATTAGQSIGGLNKAGLRGMLVYGVEDAHDNEGCDRNLKGFLHTVDVSRSLPPSSKRDAICNLQSALDSCTLMDSNQIENNRFERARIVAVNHSFMKSKHDEIKSKQGTLELGLELEFHS